jgi:hypothetical protein
MHICSVLLHARKEGVDQDIGSCFSLFSYHFNYFIFEVLPLRREWGVP